MKKNMKIWREYVTIEDIDQAYRDCKKRKGASQGYLEYSKDYLMENLRLHEQLNGMTYEVGKSRCFVVTRPKAREVFCAQFRDRIVHHLLVNKFLPLLEAEMTDTAFACRKGKGTDYGIDHVRREMERVSENYTKEAWAMKCDIEGFFMSIDRRLLFQHLKAILTSRYHGGNLDWWLWLWEKVVMNDPSRNCERVGDLTLWERLPRNKSLFTCGEDKGLPIGNLPSQVLANLLLSPFDKWMTARLGSGGYGRYVDDFVCVSTDKALLLSLAHDARIRLARLGLRMHPRKFYLQEVRKGLEMTGAVIRQGRTYIGNRSVRNLFATIEEWNEKATHTDDERRRFTRRMNSHFGHLIHRRTYAIRRKAWKGIKDRKGMYCVNMRKIRTTKNNKLLKQYDL